MERKTQKLGGDALCVTRGVALLGISASKACFFFGRNTFFWQAL